MSQLKMTTTISIENKTNERTKQPYGTKYAGTFNVRRASLQDRNLADVRKAAILNTYGNVNADLIGDWTKTSIYVWCLISIVTTDPLPEWFDLSKVYDETDEDAIMAVWEEFGAFAATFRPKDDSQAGV